MGQITRMISNFGMAYHRRALLRMIFRTVICCLSMDVFSEVERDFYDPRRKSIRVQTHKFYIYRGHTHTTARHKKSAENSNKCIRYPSSLMQIYHKTLTLFKRHKNTKMCLKQVAFINLCFTGKFLNNLSIVV